MSDSPGIISICEMLRCIWYLVFNTLEYLLDSLLHLSVEKVSSLAVMSLFLYGKISNAFTHLISISISPDLA